MRVSLLIWCAFASLMIQLIIYVSDVQANAQSALYQSGALVIIEYFLLLFACQKLCGDFLNLATLFFIITGITNVFAAGLFASGLVPNTAASVVTLISVTPIEYFIYANVMIGIALFALFLGIQTGIGRRKIHIYTDGLFSQSATKYAGIIILLVSVPAFIMTFKYDIQLFLAGGYLALFNGSAEKSDNSLNTWYLQLAKFLPVCGYFIICGSVGKEQKLKQFGLGILILSGLSSIVLGSRSGFIAPVLSYFWLRKVRGLAGSQRIIIFAGIFFVLATPFFVLWRIGGDSGTHSSSSLVETIFSGLNDLGTSYYYIPVAMENFPARLPFIHFGALTSAIANCIPNIGGLNANHAGVDRNIVYWLGINYFVNLGTGTVSIETGYSFLAEVYQSFGFIGVFPIMFVLGYALGKITEMSESTRSAYKTAFFASIIGYVLFYTRDTFSNLLRPILWYSGPVICLALFLDRYRPRPHVKHFPHTIQLD